MKPARTLRNFTSMLCVVALAAASACSSGAVPPSGPSTPGGPAGSAARPATSSPSACAVASDCQCSGNCTLCSYPAGAPGYPGLGSLLPYATDPALGVSDPSGTTNGTNPSAPYCYAPPVGTANNLLFLFLPASGGVPTQYQMILYQARSLGYYVLSLSWPNGATNGVNVNATDLTQMCGSQVQAPDDCWGEVRQNRYNGVAEKQPPAGEGSWTDLYVVPSTGVNSIEYRLTKALLNLKVQNPNWGQFLLSDQSGPQWAKIVVAGHSQGGGQAAFIGSRALVKGVMTFSSPDDATKPGKESTCTSSPQQTMKPATWVTTLFNSTTPLTSYIGLLGCQDLAFSQAVTVWSKMVGPTVTPQPLPGYDPGAKIGCGVNVDTPSAPPYNLLPPCNLPNGGQSHQLFTNAMPTTPDGSLVKLVVDPTLASHDATVLDCTTPTVSPTPSCTEYATPICAAANTNGDGTPNPQLKPAWQQMLITAGSLKKTWTAAPTCSQEAMPTPPPPP